MDCTTSRDIQEWLDELMQLKQDGRCAAPRFVKPFHLATLAHMLRTLKLKKLQLPDKIAPYADTMRLWDAVGVPSPFAEKTRAPGGRYHPIHPLRDKSTIEETAASLTQLFATVCPDPQTNNAINTMLRELLDNCYSHSAVTDGLYGLICAQVWPAGRKGQITLADSGVGIRNSLAQNALLSARLEAVNSCELATEYGVTGKPGQGHGGYGLAVARKLLEQNRGFLLVLSGNELFSSTAGIARRFQTKSSWDGTLLVIEWDLDTPMDIVAVYESLPLPEGMEDDDFNF
jgi:anti-sigma regulatory factor (Ser/Thr protein kinase)